MNFFFALLARVLPTKDVAALVAQLDKLAVKLLAAEKAQLEKAGRIDDQVAQLLKARDVAKIEADRAGRVAANVSGLIA